jgi:aryl-alcohol dehydrogenase
VFREGGDRCSGGETLAAVVAGPFAPLELRRAELGTLREDEVLVKIEAVGICHTDISVQEGKFGTPFPIVVGHERTGTVEAVGDAVPETFLPEMA